MNFSFESPEKIIFGCGKVKELGNIIKTKSDNILVVTGRSNRFAYIIDELNSKGIKTAVFNVGNEPTIENIIEGRNIAQKNFSSLVLGIGGGSVIDSAKAIAALLLNSGDIMDYLEVIGKGLPLTEPSIPCIAVPTTAGTGSEVTKNSVLKSVKHNRKVSMRSPYMIPELVIIDPELTLSAPEDVTYYTGMDAITQVIEPYISSSSNYFTDLLCKDAIGKGVTALNKLSENLKDKESRTDIAFTSLIGGLALSNAKLGAVHGFAGPMGGLFDIPHGLICGILLPGVLKANLKAVRSRGTQEQLDKYKKLATILTNRENSVPEDGITVIEDLVKKLSIPGLGKFGVTDKEIKVIVDMSKNSSSMKGNTLHLTEDELTQILTDSL